MSILIVAAHPDDEVLGCGGTIALHAERGDKVNIVFLSDGVASRDSKGIKQELEKRKKSALNASSILETEKPKFFEFPDNKFDSVALLDIVKPLEVLINDIKPSIIYTHYYGDLNIDHRITFQAVMTACRPVPNFFVNAIYSFEVLSSTEWSYHSNEGAFSPNRFIDISSTIDKKIKAIHSYKQELNNFPHSRSIEAIEAQARLRGSSVGLNAAEAFVVNRLINDIQY